MIRSISIQVRGEGEMAEAAKVSAASQDQAAATRDAAIRDAARKEEPKHRRLLRSSIDGRVLSALMLPLIAIRPPAGYAVLTTTQEWKEAPQMHPRDSAWRQGVHRSAPATRAGDRA